VRAESAAVFPHAGDSRLVEARAAAHRAVVDTLKEQGIAVRAVTTRPTKNPAELTSDCVQVICAATMLTAQRIDLAVAIAVWQGEDGPQTNVTLVDAAGNKYPGYALVLGDDNASAARAALLEARSLHLLGPGPWIHVRGNPPGADVIIDDKHVGVLPYRGPLAPGDHRVEIRAPGFGAKQLPVAVPFESTNITQVQLDLPSQVPAPLPEGTPATQSPQPIDDYGLGEPAIADAPSPWNFVIGGVLAAGGLALATIEPIQTFAREGDCAGSCSRRYAAGTDTALQISFGVLAAAAGVAVMIWQPLRIDAEASTQHATLRATLTL
jgi:hypothetical protein